VSLSRVPVRLGLPKDWSSRSIQFSAFCVAELAAVNNLDSYTHSNSPYFQRERRVSLSLRRFASSVRTGAWTH